MSINSLDTNSALVLIDLQNGIVALPTADSEPAAVTNATRLAAAFRRHRLPVVLVNVAGVAPGRTEFDEGGGELPDDFLDLIPELDVQIGDILLTKTRWGAFHGTDLHRLLQERGVTQVVIAGIATGLGVESTARAAHEHGYHVALVVDAMADMDSVRHDNSIARVFPALGQTGNTDDVLALVESRSRVGVSSEGSPRTTTNRGSDNGQCCSSDRRGTPAAEPARGRQ